MKFLIWDFSRIFNPDAETPLEYRYRSKSPFSTLWTLSQGRRPHLLLSSFLYVIKASPIWVLPILFAHIIGIISAPGAHDIHELWWALGIMLFLIIQNVFTHPLYAWTLSIVTRSIERDLREALVRRLQHLSISFHRNTGIGHLQTKLLRDVEAVYGLCSQFIELGLSSVCALTIALTITAVKEPRALLLYFLMVPLSIVLQRVFRKHLIKGNKEFRNRIENLSARLNEMLEMIPVTRAHGLEKVEIRKVGDSLNDIYVSGVRLDLITSIFSALSWAIPQIPQFVFLGVTGYYCYTYGNPKVEDVILFWGFFQTIISSVNMLISFYPAMAKGFESIRSIGEVVECPDIEKNQGKRSVSNVAGAFEFDNVSFQYAPGTPFALKDFSLKVSSGERIAVVGGSGSGKTTMLSLIIGFARPTGGRILLDGVDMETLDLRTYRRHIAVIPQETVLFNGTLLENITYGIGKTDLKKVNEVLSASNVLEFIDKLPNGLKTVIGGRGARLSGGQRQRISIARALLRDPRIIILDEPTSALDTISEKYVQEAINKIAEGRTMFIVAHRLSTIRHANRIVVLKEGRCVEVGTQDELIALNGEFRKLKDLQH